MDSICLKRGTKKHAIWHYFGIRSYSHSPHTVTIESGTQTSTGAGSFSFLTNEGQEIIDLIIEKIELLKLGNCSRVSLPGGDNNRNKIHNRRPSYNDSPVCQSVKPSVLPKPKISWKSLAPTKTSNRLCIESSTDEVRSHKKNPAPLTHSSNSEDKKNDREMEKIKSKEKKDKEKQGKEVLKAPKKMQNKEKEDDKQKKVPSTSTTEENGCEDDIYAEASQVSPYMNHFNKTSTKSDTASQPEYAAPWKDLKVTSHAPPDEIDKQYIYSYPEKPNHKPQKRGGFTYAYVEFDVEDTTPEVPTRAGLDGSSDNVYDTVGAAKEVILENVYGFESASAPIADRVKGTNSREIEYDIYETI